MEVGTLSAMVEAGKEQFGVFALNELGTPRGSIALKCKRNNLEMSVGPQVTVLIPEFLEDLEVVFLYGEQEGVSLPLYGLDDLTSGSSRS